MRTALTSLAVVLLLLMACQSKPVDVNDEIEVIEDYADLQALFDAHQDRTLVINFWATTCPPCLKEMPHFRELEEEFRGKNIRIFLVTLDLKRQLDERVYPFVRKHHITPEVVLLADQNYSAWTDEIDPSWFGALPATLIVNGEKSKFRFGMYESYDQLKLDTEEIMSLR